MDHKLKRAYQILEAAASVSKEKASYRIEDIKLNLAGYAEPGYSNPKSGIIALGDWNDVSEYNRNQNQFVTIDTTPSRVAKAFEKLGIEVEWEDEWVECDDCGKLVRCVASSYCWKPAYIQRDCSITCHECLSSSPEEHLERLEGNPRAANTIDSIDPGEHGYIRLEEFEAGFHPGQDADPVLISQALEEQGISRYLFNIDDTGQFDMSFSVWIHASEKDLLDQERYGKAKKDGPSRSERLKRGLEDASKKMPELKGEGVRVATIHDGSADAKLLSHEDFVKGKV